LYRYKEHDKNPEGEILMKTNYKKIGLALALVAGFFVVYAMNLTALSTRRATVESMSGTVEVKKNGTSKWVAASKGMVLNEGDIVRTKSGSKVVIKLDDGSINQLTSLSTLTIQKLNRSLRGKDTGMDVEVGKSWNKVKKLDVARDKFNVGTPTAVAGVRGTYFSTEVEQSTDSTFDVFEGEVAVHQRNDPAYQVAVRQNHRTEVKQGAARPANASQIPADELQAGLAGGIEGALDAGNAIYDLNIKIDPPTLQPGAKATVTVQFLENGKAYNGAVTYILNLGGSATFLQNGAQTLEVTSNEKGLVVIEITTTVREEITISADVQFEER
jgi:hypothetical protein